MIRYIDYTNHKGQRGWRKITVLNIFFGHDQWHKENQLLVQALDMEKNQGRTFAFNDIHIMMTEKEFAKLAHHFQALKPYVGLEESKSNQGTTFDEKITLDTKTTIK